MVDIALFMAYSNIEVHVQHAIYIMILQVASPWSLHRTASVKEKYQTNDNNWCTCMCDQWLLWRSLQYILA